VADLNRVNLGELNGGCLVAETNSNLAERFNKLLTENLNELQQQNKDAKTLG